MESLALTLQQKVVPALELNIDFQGQQKVSDISKLLFTVGSVLAFISGFILQDIKVTCLVFAVTSVITFLVTLPAYPSYNKNPTKFLTPKNQQSASDSKIEIQL